jgi:YD repeat-containing protein
MYKELSAIFFLLITILIGVVQPVLAGNPEIMAMPLPVTYLYGYNKSLVIAEVLNAKEGEVAYTSFEGFNEGTWAYGGVNSGSNTDRGRTGTKYYVLAGYPIQKNNLPAGKYVLSYWSRGGTASITGTNYTLISGTNGITVNGWEFHEYVFQLSATGNVVLTGYIHIDELRLHPFTAKMTTYTYEPLIGKTSETDENNITMFYEYDEFSRLKCVKDQNGHIRKNYIYHIKDQQ